MKKEIGIILGALIIILVGAYFLNKPAGNSVGTKYNTFAQCLKDSGTVFYGAFWCPHCKAQKALFGDAVKLLPYVECSTPDGQGQTPVCVEKKIESYPTWVFPNGERLSGEVSFANLSEKSGCALPAGDVTATTTQSNGATVVSSTTKAI
jgi:thiol-disulfide isomerase/thioredoxin